jgi:nickel superoxide dismutase
MEYPSTVTRRAKNSRTRLTAKRYLDGLTSLLNEAFEQVGRDYWKGTVMTLLHRLNALLDASTTPLVASAHCDLPCGVYDPAQARIEAQSVKGIIEKFNASTDADFKTRALFIKEERCDLVKHHLWVLWTDYFKPDHLKEYPNLNDLFWMATKTAGEAKKSTDVVVADRLLAEIDDIAEIFWATKK